MQSTIYYMPCHETELQLSEKTGPWRLSHSLFEYIATLGFHCIGIECNSFPP